MREVVGLKALNKFRFVLSSFLLEKSLRTGKDTSEVLRFPWESWDASGYGRMGIFL